MVWNVISSIAYTPSDDGAYRFLELSSPLPIVAYGVSLQVGVGGNATRRRVGFFYAFVAVDDRQLFGPSEEMLSGIAGQPPAIHQVGFRWAEQYTGVIQRVSAYGVAVAPDRGAFPATLTLWGLT